RRQTVDAPRAQVRGDRSPPRRRRHRDARAHRGGLALAAAALRGSDRRLRPFSPLRYRAVMRKTPTKLTLRKEALRTLSTINLAHVVGGEGDGAPFAGALTHENGCPAVMALKA